MNIQRYYQNSAQASLNGSLIACIPPCLIVVYHSYFQAISGLIWWCLPFIIYSVSTYQAYRFLSKQANAVVSPYRKKVNVFSQREFLIGFLPAPSIRLLLFTKSGQAVAELRDSALHKWRWFLPVIVDKWFYRNRYTLVVEEERVALITLHKNKIQIAYNSQTILIHKESNKCYICKESGRIYHLQYARTFMNLLIQTATGKELARLQKGWMPREWTEMYRQSNKPFLMINQTLTIEEQLIIYSLLILYLKNVQH